MPQGVKSENTANHKISLVPLEEKLRGVFSPSFKKNWIENVRDDTCSFTALNNTVS